MNPPEHDTPSDEVSGEEERERLLSEALADAAAHEAAFRRPTSDTRGMDGRKATLALVIVLIAGYLALSPPSWLGFATEPALARAERVRGIHAAMYLQAQEIDAYHAVRGELPHSLDELPARVPGIRFVRSDSRVYQLVGRSPDGSSVVYDSAHPDSSFAAAAAVWNEGSRP